MNTSRQVATKKIKITAKLHSFDNKTSTSLLIPGKIGPRKEIFS